MKNKVWNNAARIRGIIVLLLITVPSEVFGETPSVIVNAGSIEYHSSDGRTTTLVEGENFQSPALSPDRRSFAYIHALKPENEDLDGEAELWIGDRLTGRQRRLIRPHPSPDPKARMQWFDGPIFSADGKSIYVNALAWGDEGAVHQVNIVTGKEHFVIDGGLISVMRTGPYRGYLIVARHTPWPLPKVGYHYPLYLVKPDGTILFRVPNMDADDDRVHLETWLKAHAWKAW